MSIIYEWDKCPSYLMYYGHKCPSCERPSWWNQWNVLVGGKNQNNMVTFKVHMELMESEVRECRGYGTDWIIGTGERETIDQGLDGMEGKDLNEGIRTMALMEFMKLMEPTQLMEGLIYVHGADLSGSIDGAYENNRICVFSFM